MAREVSVAYNASFGILNSQYKNQIGQQERKSKIQVNKIVDMSE